MTTGGKWAIFAAIIVGGITAAIVIDFVTDHPLQVLAIMLLALAWAGRSAPFNYTSDALRDIASRAPMIEFLRGCVDPMVIAAGLISAGFGLLHHGLDHALVMLVALYTADRVAAWTITQERRRCADRYAARRNVAVGVVVDKPAEHGDR